MIDKDKLIEFSETHSLDLTREQIDTLVESSGQFCGSFPKPYEVRIDFSAIVIELLSLITDLRNRVDLLECFSKSHSRTAEPNGLKTDDSCLDSVEL